MDQELVAFFEKKFGETAQQIAGLQEQTTQQIASLREETAQQFADLRQETAQQFADLRQETAQQFASLREETSERFERVEESIRYTQITVEKMRGEIQLLAEGVSGFDEKLETVRKELRAEIGEVRDLLTVSYRDLNQRIGQGPARTRRPRPTS